MKSLLCLVLLSSWLSSHAQNVGIGTSNPVARLHVADSSVLFTGTYLPIDNTRNPPMSGSGTRMMWFATKGAFRTGTVLGANWDKDSIGMVSFASGWNTKAKGSYSTSLGNQTVAEGTNATSMGAYSMASNYVATSFGNATLASGGYSTSMGNSTIASGETSTSMGDRTTASARASTSMGHLTSASGENATSMGSNTKASGYGSTSMGSYTIASGSFATTMGTSTEAREYNATSMGYSTIALSAHSLAIGIYNDTLLSNRLFEIGNGTSQNRANAVTVITNGNMGIGTTTPVTKLDITGGNNWDLSNTEGDFRIGNSSYRIKMGIATGGGGAGAASIRSAGGIERLNLGAGNTTLLTLNGASGRAGIGIETPAEKLEVVGNVRANAFILSSDLRLKKNIMHLSSSLSQLTQLNGYNYYWKDETIDSSLQSGLIAQEVQKLFPHLVKENSNGDLAVNYIGLIPVMIESTKAQQRQIEKLQQQFDELKKLVEKLLQNNKPDSYTSN